MKSIVIFERLEGGSELIDFGLNVIEDLFFNVSEDERLYSALILRNRS